MRDVHSSAICDLMCMVVFKKHIYLILEVNELHEYVSVSSTTYILFNALHAGKFAYVYCLRVFLLFFKINVYLRIVSGASVSLECQKT